MDELNGGQRTVFVNGVCHQVQGGDIFVGPEAGFVCGGQIGGRMDFGFLGGHNAPTALGLDAAMGCFGVGVTIAHASAMGHLVKAIARGVGADLHGFEQDIKTRIAHGSGSCLVVAKLGVMEVTVCTV